MNVLNIDQMLHLKSLGVDISNASMCWIKNPCQSDTDKNYNDYELSTHDESCYEMSCLNPIPAFNLQDILNVLQNVKYESRGCPILLFDYNYLLKVWVIAFRNPIGFNNPEIKEDTPIKAAYEMLIWCIYNGYLKTQK